MVYESKNENKKLITVANKYSMIMEKIDQILESLYDRVIEPVEAKKQLLNLFAVMPSLPIERFDAEDWLGQNKDIWNHPRVTDRNNKESYEVADLMAEFAMSFFGQ